MRKFAQGSRMVARNPPRDRHADCTKPCCNTLPAARFAIAMKQFVPLTDEMLYGLAGPPVSLVPYRCGMVCRRELVEERKPAPRPREWCEEAVIPSALLLAHLPA